MNIYSLLIPVLEAAGDLKIIIKNGFARAAGSSKPLGAVVDINRLLTALMEMANPDYPVVELFLPDGRRLRAVFPPLVFKSPVIIVDRPPAPLTLDDLVNRGVISGKLREYLVNLMREKRNVLISGKMRSGKSTLLEALLTCIPEEENLVVVEHQARLNIRRRNVNRLAAFQEHMAMLTWNKMDKIVARLSPDRLAVDDIYYREHARLLLRAPVVAAVVCAPSPREAVKTLRSLLIPSILWSREAGRDYGRARQIAASKMDVVAHMENGRVTEVVEVEEGRVTECTTKP